MRLTPSRRLPEGKIVDKIYHGGIVLPVYDPKTVIWSRKGLEALHKATRQYHIVRYARVDVENRFRLGEFLPRADAVFNKVAYACGAQIVEHSWGLSRPPSRHIRKNNLAGIQFLHPDLPAGTSLVAKVAVLLDARQPEIEEWQTIQDIVTDTYDASPVGRRWSEGGSHQMLRSSRGLFITDIEPLVD